MQDFRPSRFEILPTIVKNLLIINGLMYLATVVIEQTYRFDLTNLLGLHYFTSPIFQPFQLLTHMFMHGSFMHILSNMFALWMFGSTIENVWGPKRFLIFYIICGFGGAAAHLGVTFFEINSIQNDINYYMANASPVRFLSLMKSHPNLLYSDTYVDTVNAFYNAWSSNPNDPNLIFHSKELAQELALQKANIPVVGASGAVFGVLLAFGMMFPNTLLYFYFLFPIKAKYFVIGYGLFELYSGFTGSQDGVAHFAHLGGMAVGFIMIKYWNRNRRQDFF